MYEHLLRNIPEFNTAHSRGMQGLLDLRRRASIPCVQSYVASSREPELDLAFWSSVDYCGFYRRTFEPGTMRTTSFFANAAYAEYAGLSAAELIARSILLSY